MLMMNKLNKKKFYTWTQMRLIEEIMLANGLKLKIFDLSRTIAAKTVKVEISLQTKIPLKKSYFTDDQDYTLVKNTLGAKLAYEHKLERSFVPEENEDSVRDDLINTFKSNSLDYLAAANFPQKMALSMLKEIKNNPYKYQSRATSDPEE
jgi:hypothetical protein